MSDKGVVERNYNEGVLGAKLAFIDESFDIRPGALRNLLDVLAERSHSQGTKQHKGLTELVIAATNKTLPEVYQEHNNTEAPRALIDRFAFTILVPKEMESIKSDRAIFRGERAQAKPVHQISFADLDAIRSLVPKVKIPDYIADLAAMVHYRLAPELEAREVKSMEQYREKVQNGEHSLPPFRASKYMSPRTLGKAGNILKAIVVLDYVEKGGNRSLTATTEDLSKLRAFYQMGGPKDQFLDKQLARALKEEEKEQIKSVKTEREVVNPIFDETLKGFNEAIAGYKLQEVDRMAKDYSILPNTEKRKLMDVLKYMFHQGVDSLNKTDKEEITAETIAASASVELVQGYVKTLFREKADKILEQWQKELGYSSKKVLTAKQMRKQQFRYGYGEKLEVAGKEKRPKLPNAKSKGKTVELNESRVVYEPHMAAAPLTFDFAGDKIVLFKHGTLPTWVAVDGKTDDWGGNWASPDTVIKGTKDGDMIASFTSDELYSAKSPGIYHRIRRPHQDRYLGIAPSASEANVYYSWSVSSLFKVTYVDGRLSDGHPYSLPSTLPVSPLKALSDFDPIRNRVFVIGVNRYNSAELYVETFVPESHGGYETEHGLSISNQDYITDGWNLDNSRALLLNEDKGIALVSSASMLNREFVFVDLKAKVIQSLTLAQDHEKLADVQISLDRQRIALTYQEPNRVEIYDVETFVKNVESKVTPTPQIVLTQKEGGQMMERFLGARFSDDGHRVLVSGQHGFLVFDLDK
jgi:hypothetical protein